jgi:hypothetical protein
MMTLIPTSVFSWNFRVLLNDQHLTLIRRRWFRERATFEIEGRAYEMRRTSWIHGSFVLACGGRALAEATKPSLFRRSFEIVADHRHFELEAVSAFHREFRLRRGSETLGTVRPRSFFSRTATADFAESIPLHVQLFVTVLVLVLWKRAADAAAT